MKTWKINYSFTVAKNHIKNIGENKNKLIVTTTVIVILVLVINIIISIIKYKFENPLSIKEQRPKF